MSGSDDRSVRVWDINQGSEAISVLGGFDVKNSHESNIRALAFLPEISWCVLTGSWDSKIKLWDIRNGQCMYTITDHNADVYGISFHPDRPFLFASCSRDTTIRLFVVDGLISSLKMQLLVDAKIDNSQKQVFDSPYGSFGSKGSYKLCTQRASDLIHRTATNGYLSPLEQFLELYDFMQFSEGQAELFTCVRAIAGELSDTCEELQVRHISQLPEAHNRRA